MRLFDTHCHLDLYPDYAKVISEIDRDQIFTISVTTTPSVFEKTSQVGNGSRWIQTALGFHPELAVQREKELPLFMSLLSGARFIGEVGLDFVDNKTENKAIQKNIFAKILDSCAGDPSKVLTIHSRRAADTVVSMIGKKYPATTILHWFTGAPSLAIKAVENGCYFSVNPAMIASTKGMELIRSIPVERLLLESDGPFATIAGKPCRPADTRFAIQGMAMTLNQDEDELALRLISNLERILGVAIPAAVVKEGPPR